jgi:PAS domain S-box-containing protein
MDRIPSVIVLDDNDNLRKMLEDILRVKGFHPIPLRLGMEAVERVRQEEIDVALIDLHLEDLTGLEVLRRIRQESPSTECILLTGHASQDSAIEAINLGAYSYYQKPFDTHQLLLSIQHAVEKRAAARALSESQARYHTFVNAATDMAFLKDDQFRYVLVNEANVRFFGKPIAEIIGRDDFELMTEEAAQACRESDRRALEENGPVVTVEEVKGRFYETRKFPVPLEGGRTGVGGYIRDITARVEAENRMRLQSAALEASANAIVITDRQAVIRWANPAFSVLTGYPLEETVGRNPRDLVKSGRQGPEFYTVMWNTILSGQVWRGELINRRKDGALYSEEMTITPVPDDSGKPQYFIAVKQDISERKRAETSLQQNENRYRSLFHDSPISLWEEDFSAVKKRLDALRKKGVRNFAAYLKSHPDVVEECAALVRVLDVNQATLDLYRAKDKDELLGALTVVFSKESFESFRDELTAIAEGKPRFHWEGVNQTLDGKRLEISLNWSVAPGYESDLSRVIVSIVDVTERKRAERDLRQAESRLRAIVEQVPAIVYTESAEEPAATLFISPQVEALTGYTPDEWINDRGCWQRIIHPDDLERVLAEDAYTARTGEPFRVEYRILTRDGRTLWIQDEAVLIRDGRGRPLFWQGIMYDITERKQAEAALRESEQRYQTLTEISPAGIFHTDADGLTTYVNRRWCEISGLEAGAALGDGWLQAVHPDDRARLAAGWQEAVARQAISTSEYRFVRPDGSIAWVIGQAAPEKDTQGNIIGYVGAITDITARKRAEEDLIASEERYRMLAENMSDTVWLMDLNLKAVYISPSVTKLRGYTREELNALPLDKQMEPDSLRKALDIFVEALSPETLSQTSQPIVRRVELEFYRKDGTTFWSDNTFTLIRNPDGTPRMILGVGRDISERKQAQEALENSEKRFRALIENSSDIIILLDPRGKELYHSPAYWKVTGRNPGDWIGRHFLENIHPDDQPQANKAFNEVLLHPGQVRSVAFRSLHRDGGWRCLEATLSNLLGEPAVRSIVLNLRDITERRRAEQNLARRAAELEMLYENGLAVSGLLDVQEICRRLIGVIEEKMQWHHLAVRLLDPDTNAIRVAAFNQPGLSEKQKRAHIARLNRKVSRVGEGLSGWVIQHGQTVRSGNVQADERYVQSFPGICSGLYAPLKAGDRVIGSIAVESEQPDAFSEQDERLLITLAAQTAIAIENARLYQKTLLNSRRNAALHQAGLEIARAGNNLEAIYAALHRAVEGIMPAQAFSIAFVNESRTEIRGIYLVEKGERLPNALLPLDGLNGYVINTGTPLRIENLKREKKLKYAVIGGPDVSCSYLAVPLLAAGKVIGVISAQSYQPGQYSEEDQALLETLASEAVIAIENARLFSETQNRLRYISALHRIDAAINASVDLRVTMGIILENVTKELGVDAAALLLMNPYTQTLEYSASRGFRATLVEGIRLHLGEGLAGKAALERRLLSLADMAAVVPDIFESENFRSQFAVPLIAKGQIQGVLQVCHRSPLDPAPEWTGFLNALAGQAAMAVDNSRLFENLQRSNLDLTFAYDATIQGWSNALDMRDKETEGHSQRVTELTVNLAIAMGVRDVEIEHIRRGALLHDIGKLGIPDAILLKPAVLTEEEWEIMRRHPLYAYDLLSPIEYLRPALDIPYCHHEKWDGSGYPRGLAGEQIPLAARIFAVADVWDALTSDRPYRPAWSKAQALEYIRSQAGKQFDPAVVEVFLTMQNK